MISAGVPILDAINVTRETAGNEVYARLLGAIHNSIRQGDTFAGPLRQSKNVDLLVNRARRMSDNRIMHPHACPRRTQVDDGGGVWRQYRA